MTTPVEQLTEETAAPHRRRRRGARGAAAADARDRERPLKVFVTAAERAEIHARARATGLSVSSYLRAVGTGYEPRSAYDLDAVDSLARVNGDLGRFGGLLKLWLGERPGQGARVADVEGLLRQTRELQRRMLDLMARV